MARCTSMPIHPDLIEKTRADKLIAEIEDPALRRSVSLLVDGVVEFYNQDPSRLQSSFDLGFFAEVLKEMVDWISRALLGTTNIAPWSGEPAQPTPVDPTFESDPGHLRSGQAYNYSVTREDKRVEAALLSLITRAELKQSLKLKPPISYAAHGVTLAVPALPVQPLDFLFMVMAADYALQPGQPARLALEGKS